MSKRSKRRRDRATAGEAVRASSGDREGKAGRADRGNREGKAGQADRRDRLGMAGRADRTGRSVGPQRARPGGPAAAEPREAGRFADRGAGQSWGLGVQLAFVVAVFAVVALVAELAGAANLGVALGIGQIAFAIAVVYVLVRR
jgi:hypothetical protein